MDIVMITVKNQFAYTSICSIQHVRNKKNKSIERKKLFLIGITFLGMLIPFAETELITFHNCNLIQNVYIMLYMEIKIYVFCYVV